jgi:signal transduction histidine kinase
MLAYTIAALIFWFISLNSQNVMMADLKMRDLYLQTSIDSNAKEKILAEQKRKTTQYIGEGVTFFLVILTGAIFIFRAVRRQLKQTVQQQNFMMAITHELKTPIAVAQLNLETLQKRKLDEPQQQRLIHNTLQETIRLNNLCNNMLLSSQIDAGGYRMTHEELNFSDLVLKCIQDFTSRFPARKIEHIIEPEVFITGDELLLQMAVNNLLDNAIKYSPKGTPVVISLKQDDAVVFEIRNEGVGINNEDKKKVFEKFYRAGNNATKTAKGTGLGLYLIFKVIKAHHGTIGLSDNEPSGAVFTINLQPAQLNS